MREDLRQYKPFKEINNSVHYNILKKTLGQPTIYRRLSKPIVEAFSSRSVEGRSQLLEDYGLSFLRRYIELEGAGIVTAINFMHSCIEYGFPANVLLTQMIDSIGNLEEMDPQLHDTINNLLQPKAE
jgi:hypothetical protein